MSEDESKLTVERREEDRMTEEIKRAEVADKIDVWWDQIDDVFRSFDDSDEEKVWSSFWDEEWRQLDSTEDSVKVSSEFVTTKVWSFRLLFEKWFSEIDHKNIREDMWRDDDDEEDE